MSAGTGFLLQNNSETDALDSRSALLTLIPTVLCLSMGLPSSHSFFILHSSFRPYLDCRRLQMGGNDDVLDFQQLTTMAQSDQSPRHLSHHQGFSYPAQRSALTVLVVVGGVGQGGLSPASPIASCQPTQNPLNEFLVAQTESQKKKGHADRLID